MKRITIVQAINDALDSMLAEYPEMVLYGEDVGYEGGVFRVTADLQKKFGEDRVFDSTLAESGIAGTAIGMAAAGLMPVIEMQFSGFSYPAFNQIISHLSRMRNRTRGKYPMPVVIRMPYGGGINAVEHHSESMEAIYGHIPGLQVMIPSTPHDAKGMLMGAIESNDPVVFMEPKRIYRSVKQEVPDEKYVIPAGKARVVSPGNDITLVSYGALMRESYRAIAMAEKEGYSVELIDLRSIYPLDKKTIINSVKKTGKLLIVNEAPKTFGVAAEIMAFVNEEAFLYLEAPPKRLTGFDTIVPYPKGEFHYMVSDEKILHAILQTVNY